MPNTNDLDMGYLLRVEPKVAVDYLKAKGYQITWNWQEMLDDAHARAFTVAKVTRMDILETIRLATEKAIAEGVSERDYIANLKPRLEALGWWGKTAVYHKDRDGNIIETKIQQGSPRRLATILRNNKIAAYNAGRYAEQMANVDEEPYWQYLAVKDSRTRASHLALHEKVYRYDDPIWQTMYPPNDFNCRCRVRALSERRLNKLGLKVSQSNGEIKQGWAIAGVDKVTGEETHAKVTSIMTDQGTMTTSPGWNYNVGLSAVGTDIALIRKILTVKNRDLRSQTIQAINNSEARHKAFANWVGQMLSKDKHDNHYIGVGIITPYIANQVAELSKTKFAERVLVMSERNFTHSNSPKHRDKGIALSKDEYANLPLIIANPKLVLWDKTHQNLIYLNQDKTIKVIVEVSPKKLKLQPKEQLDTIINTYKADYPDIVGKIKKGDYLVIQGEVR